MNSSANSENSNVAPCQHCKKDVDMKHNCFFWERMIFCQVECVGKFQIQNGSKCTHCSSSTPVDSLGKYSVRFDTEISQFCNESCLDDFRKELDFCSFCQSNVSKLPANNIRILQSRNVTKKFCSFYCCIKYETIFENLDQTIKATCSTCKNMVDTDITENSKVAPCQHCKKDVDMKHNCFFWEGMIFCKVECVGEFQIQNGYKCTHCSSLTPVDSLGKYSVRFSSEISQFCNESCLDEFRKELDFCSFCQSDVSKLPANKIPTLELQKVTKKYCSMDCFQKYVTIFENLDQTIQATCSTCNKTVDTDITLHFNNEDLSFCNSKCLSIFCYLSTKLYCDTCQEIFENPAENQHTFIHNNSIKNFCTKQCLNFFILASRKIYPCISCKVKKYNYDMISHLNEKGQYNMCCSLLCYHHVFATTNPGMPAKYFCSYCYRWSEACAYIKKEDSSFGFLCSQLCIAAYQSQKSNTSRSTSTTENTYCTDFPKKGSGNSIVSVGKKTKSTESVEGQTYQTRNSAESDKGLTFKKSKTTEKVQEHTFEKKIASESAKEQNFKKGKSTKMVQRQPIQKIKSTESVEGQRFQTKNSTESDKGQTFKKSNTTEIIQEQNFKKRLPSESVEGQTFQKTNSTESVKKQSLQKRKSTELFEEQPFKKIKLESAT